MIVKELSEKEFLSTVPSNRSFDVISISTPYCGLCKQNKQKLIDSDIEFFYFETEDEDILMNNGIKGVPCTIIRDTNDKEIYHKEGLLFDKQFDEIREIIR